MADQVVTIEALPPELLGLIFGLLDKPAPSDGRLNDQPADDMLRNPDPDCSLKNISRVSKRWRAIALPLLFRNVVWTLESCIPLLAKPAAEDSDPASEPPILAFLRANDLARHVRSFTIIVHRTPPPPEPVPDSTGSRSIFSFLNIAQWRQDRFGRRSSSEEALEQRYKMMNADMTYHQDNTWLWDMVFGVVDPLRFTIIASPQSLARLLSCTVFLGDADFFSAGEQLHILSLFRDSRSTTAPPKPSNPNASKPKTTPKKRRRCRCCPRVPKRAPPALFTLKPWTHLLLNENSSIRVYSSYHYFDRRPPSILRSLLGCEASPNDTSMVPATVTSFSYVAIFPLATHFLKLVHYLPRVEHLFVQLVPRNDILLDKDAMAHVQASDLWLERNTCYESIMRRVLVAGQAEVSSPGDDDGGGGGDAEGEAVGDDDDDDSLFNYGAGPLPPRRPNNWPFLRRFETGDAGDQEAWESAVEWVHLSQTGWRVEREGLFVRGGHPAKERDGEDGGSSST